MGLAASVSIDALCCLVVKVAGADPGSPVLVIAAGVKTGAEASSCLKKANPGFCAIGAGARVAAGGGDVAGGASGAAVGVAAIGSTWSEGVTFCCAIASPGGGR